MELLYEKQTIYDNNICNYHYCNKKKITNENSRFDKFYLFQ